MVHDETPSIQILHRTLAEPRLRVRCLVDMAERGPGQVPLNPSDGGYAEAFINRKHSTGGTYHELGGNLQPKS